MNHDLIKQLELAIQVERGEVPLSEVERRLNADYISTDNSRLVWHPAPGTHTPKHWNFREYEYRNRGTQ